MDIFVKLAGRLDRIAQAMTIDEIADLAKRMKFNPQILDDEVESKMMEDPGRGTKDPDDEDPHYWVKEDVATLHHLGLKAQLEFLFLGDDNNLGTQSGHPHKKLPMDEASVKKQLLEWGDQVYRGDEHIPRQLPDGE